jgi:MerR family transcriptional regulator/heat shock protein HspR
MPATYDDPAAPFFTVGQVADMLDVRQAFLRRLDQFGLVSPARSEGAQRRYSRDDIDDINVVCGLLDDGLTLEGARQVIALQAEVTRLRAEVKKLKSR